MRLPADATPQTFYLPSLAGSIDYRTHVFRAQTLLFLIMQSKK